MSSDPNDTSGCFWLIVASLLVMCLCFGLGVMTGLGAQ